MVTKMKQENDGLQKRLKEISNENTNKEKFISELRSENSYPKGVINELETNSGANTKDIRVGDRVIPNEYFKGIWDGSEGSVQKCTFKVDFDYWRTEFVPEEYLDLE